MARPVYISETEIQRAKQLRNQAKTVADLRKALSVIIVGEHGFTADQTANLEGNANYLKEKADLKICIEGHCDERGTNEYNFALGERRAKSVLEFLISRGVAADRLSIVSKGEEEPADPGKNEAAYAKNRRAMFLVTQ